jgi:zinc protease
MNSEWNSRRLLRFAWLVLMAAMAPAAASAQGIHLPPHEKVVLKNGLTVLLLEKHGVPMVSLVAVVKSGATVDPAGKEGLASVTAGLLRKGTKNRSAQQFAADLDFTGGSFDAGAGEDFTTVSAEFLTKDIARGLDLFTDALLRPVFPQDETEKLLRQRLDGIVAAKDEVRAVLPSYFNGYLFGSHPYARPAGGDEISLGRIRREDVQRFYGATYSPGNTILAVAGDFSAAEMRKKIEQVFSSWTAGGQPAARINPAVPVAGKRLLLVDKPDLTQTFFAIGNVGTAAGDPDRVAIRVVNTIFGGRFTSVLNEELRVKSGLTYGANSRFDNRKMPGPFYIFSFTQNTTTVQAIDMALKVLEDLHKNGVTKEQLDSAKSYIKGQFPPTIETSLQLATRIATNEFFDLDDSEVNQLEARLDAVTPEGARQAIRKHFPLENLVFVLIGKAAEIKPAVAKYAAKMDTRSISEPGFWPPPAGSPAAPK